MFRLFLILISSLSFVSTALALPKGTVVRVIAEKSNFRGLIGVVQGFNGVMLTINVDRVVSRDAPFIAPYQIQAPLGHVRISVPDDLVLKPGADARVTDPESGLAGLYGKVLARDGKSVVWESQRRMDMQPMRYLLVEEKLSPVRPKRIRPQPGDVVQIQKEGHSLNGIQGEALFQNGSEALIRYVSNNGRTTQTYLRNDLLKPISAVVSPDFRLEVLDEALNELALVSYSERKAFYERLAKGVKRVAPLTQDAREASHVLAARTFILGAIHPILTSNPSEVEEKSVVPEYEEALKAYLPAGGFNSIVYSAHVAGAAALVLEATVFSLKGAVTGADASELTKLVTAVGVYSASSKGAEETQAFLNALRAAEPVFSRLEKNLRLQDDVIVIRAVTEYLDKRF